MIIHYFYHPLKISLVINQKSSAFEGNSNRYPSHSQLLGSSVYRDACIGL
ncbi:hypothetical protein PEC311524_23650 [Pectobacterium carotovorum subsp. carotovorum]|nr:hypothetical protein PEC311524_23650 [Pectobacterium carotovorum subsp. carotovorum]